MANNSIANTYSQMETATSLELERLSMLKAKIESEEKLMRALVTYYSEQEVIAFRNEQFGFDLSLRR